ncbi:hypothetical protein ALC57_06205, partial [Trachymyrmex cornetzi]
INHLSTCSYYRTQANLRGRTSNSLQELSASLKLLRKFREKDREEDISYRRKSRVSNETAEPEVIAAQSCGDSPLEVHETHSVRVSTAPREFPLNRISFWIHSRRLRQVPHYIALLMSLVVWDQDETLQPTTKLRVRPP